MVKSKTFLHIFVKGWKFFFFGSAYLYGIKEAKVGDSSARREVAEPMQWQHEGGEVAAASRARPRHKVAG